MIVCVCNHINDRKVTEAHAEGARKAKHVFQKCGTKPQCGTCVRFMQAQLDELTNKEKAED